MITRTTSYPRTALLLLVSSSLLLIAISVLQAASVFSPSGTTTPLTRYSTDIERWQAAIQRMPSNINATAQLGLSLLQEAQITEDVQLYAEAESAFDTVLAVDPDHVDAMIGMGMLTLARHDFTDALEWADEIAQVSPMRAEVLGIRVDALVELGRYAEAVEVAEELAMVRPGLDTYSRISYLRQLHGDMDGAIAAMQAARDAGVPGSEPHLWSQMQLADLYAERGDYEAATALFTAALADRPDYLHAQARLASIEAAKGNFEQAIAQYEQALAGIESPPYDDLIALGELYAITGEDERASQQFALATTILRASHASGMDASLEMARSFADHGDGALLSEAEKLARTTYTRRPTIYSADTLAWALHRNDKTAEAWPYTLEALRLNTEDAMLYYHAGVIAHALNDLPAAKEHLVHALAINSTFSPTDAPHAHMLLDEMIGLK